MQYREKGFNMSNKVILLTGIPGIGKSTISRLMVNKLKNITSIGFGDLIYEVLHNEGKKPSRNRIKTTPDKFVTINTIKTAAEILLKKIAEIRLCKNVLIESHAVVRDSYGFWIIPEINDFKKAQLDAIIVIHATFEIFEKRMKESTDGRYLISGETFSKYQSLQDSVAINFSLLSDCPLYIVETDNDLESTENSLLHIFKNIGIEIS